MKEIKLSRGMVALVDDIDYEFINQWKWSATSNNGSVFYASKTKWTEGKSKTIKMHRLLLNVTDPKIIIDHKDRNGLNNQRDNLRIATISQNGKNRSSAKGSSSVYLGVFYREFKRKNKTYKYWHPVITVDKKQHHLGYFKEEKEAAIAYNEAAKKFHGEFANLNIIDNQMCDNP